MSVTATTSTSVVRLGTVLSAIEAGKSLKAESRPAGPGERGVLKLSAVTRGDFDPRENKALPPDADVTGVPTVGKGDLLISRANTTELVGAVAIPEGSFPNLILSDKTLRLVVDPSCVDTRYLCYALRTSAARQHIESRATGTSDSMRNVSQDAIREIPVPLPPLPDQRRIAAILDEADALRRKRREALGLLDDLLRSAFREMFGDPVTNPRGWPTVDLDSLLVDGPTNGLYRPSSDYGVGTPIVRIDSFYDGAITDLSGLKRVGIGKDVIDRFALAPGQVLINRVNSPEHLGKAALVPQLSEPTVFESNIMRLTLDPRRVVPTFLVNQLLSPFVRRQIANSAKDAVNQSSINQSDVRCFKIRLPPVDVQRRWEAYVTAHRAHTAASRRRGNETDRLFDSLLHRAFTGELARPNGST